MSDTTEITYSNKADGLSSLAAAAGADSKYANAMKFLREGALRDAPQENATTRDIEETRAAQRSATTKFEPMVGGPFVPMAQPFVPMTQPFVPMTGDVPATSDSPAVRAAFTEAAAPQPAEPAPEIAPRGGVATPNADGSLSLPEVRINATALKSEALNLPAAIEPIAPMTTIERQALAIPSVVVAEAPKQLAPVEVAKPVSVAKQVEPKRAGRALKDIILTVIGAQSSNFRRDEYMQQMYPVPQKPENKGPTLGR